MEKETIHVKEGAEERVGLGKETGGDERGGGAGLGEGGWVRGCGSIQTKSLEGSDSPVTAGNSGAKCLVG